jgi:hypothetical protein
MSYILEAVRDPNIFYSVTSGFACCSCVVKCVGGTFYKVDLIKSADTAGKKLSRYTPWRHIGGEEK